MGKAMCGGGKGNGPVTGGGDGRVAAYYITYPSVRYGDIHVFINSGLKVDREG